MKKLFKKIIPVLICTLILCAAAVFSFASEAPVIIKTGDFTIELFDEYINTKHTEKMERMNSWVEVS